MIAPSSPASATWTVPSDSGSVPASFDRRRRILLPPTETRTIWRKVTLDRSGIWLAGTTATETGAASVTGSSDAGTGGGGLGGAVLGSGLPGASGVEG